MHIVSSGSYCKTIDNELDELKELVQQSLGVSVRRVSRFIQLALIGAGRAAQNIDPQTGIYLSSGRGDIGVTLDILEEIYQHNQPPRPLNFINSVSNAACFHIARALGIQGISNFVTSRYLAFETALQLALTDMQSRRLESALVGAVDVVTTPLPEHRQRLELNKDQAVAEASHWIQLQQRPESGQKIIATVKQFQTFSNQPALEDWINTQTFSPSTVFCAGQYIDQEKKRKLTKRINCETVDYSGSTGHFDSQAGLTICNFLQQSDAANNMLYIGGDIHERYIAVVIEKIM